MTLIKGGCGLHCLNLIFNHFNHQTSFDAMLRIAKPKPGFGLFDTQLGLIALYNGFDVTINKIGNKKMEELHHFELQNLSSLFLKEFLENGGKYYFKENINSLITNAIDNNYLPIIGVNLNIFYKKNKKNTGHFIILNGYSDNGKTLHIYDPAALEEGKKSFESSQDSTFINECITKASITDDNSIIIVKPS